MAKSERTDFDKFDAVMRKVLSVSREELKAREERWKQQRQKKRRAKISPASRAQEHPLESQSMEIVRFIYPETPSNAGRDAVDAAVQ